MNPLALDLSLTASGFASPRGSGVLSPPKDCNRGVERLAWIRESVLSLAVLSDVVVIEGYAYARANQAHQIGELGGVIRLGLHDHGIPFVEIPPSTLKKLATGRGNSGKEAVLAEAIRRLGYQGSDNNEADALWLLQVALHALDLPGAVDLPKAHLAALDPERWEGMTVSNRHTPTQPALELSEVGS